jgi:hypothetical protein
VANVSLGKSLERRATREGDLVGKLVQEADRSPAERRHLPTDTPDKCIGDINPPIPERPPGIYSVRYTANRAGVGEPYPLPGPRFYGKTANGGYTSESDALKAAPATRSANSPLSR